MLRHVILARPDVSEEGITFFRVTRIDELGTTLAVTSNRITLQPHGVTSHKPAFFRTEIFTFLRVWGGHGISFQYAIDAIQSRIFCLPL
jgi:hypothetical protein